MKRHELINELNKRGISKDLYTFDEILPHDKFVVFFDNLKWHVYYSERGAKFQEKSFVNESDAYSYLLSLV